MILFIFCTIRGFMAEFINVERQMEMIDEKLENYNK